MVYTHFLSSLYNCFFPYRRSVIGNQKIKIIQAKGFIHLFEYLFREWDCSKSSIYQMKAIFCEIKLCYLYETLFIKNLVMYNKNKLY